MKSIRNKQSSLLTKYTELYEKKPKSRVFAPLAETYRKLGMYDEAFSLLRKGINLHPSYTLGYIVLANCYYDQGKIELSYNVLRPHVDNNLENISLQKLFSKVCEQLGYLEEALQTYKYLLLLNPSDKESAEKVKELEEDLSYQADDTTERVRPYQREQNLATEFENEDDWVQVNFNSPLVDKPLQELQQEEAEGASNWSMGDLSTPQESNLLEKFKDEVSLSLDSIAEKPLDDEYYYEEYDNYADDVVEADDQESETPFITHTLVDLFLKQGHKDKAIEILENIIHLHPEDEASKLKLKQIGHSGEEISENAHEELLDLIEEKRKKESHAKLSVEKKLQEFLNMLQITAKEHLR